MKTPVCILFSLFSFFSFAQDEFKPETQTQYSIDLGFSGLQGAAEIKTARTHTIQFRTGVIPVFLSGFDYNTGNHQRNVSGSLNLSTEYRIYYNFPFRLERRRDIRNNGANYFSFLVSYTSKPLINKPEFTSYESIFMAGPMWGFNRSLGEKFLFHLSLGPVYEKYNYNDFRDKQVDFNLYADLRWSFLFK